MSNLGVDNALNRLFANATREMMGRSQGTPPEQLLTRSTGFPGGGVEPTPPKPPEPLPPSINNDYMTGQPVQGKPQWGGRFEKHGIFSIPNSPEEWIDSLAWWGKQIGRQVGGDMASGMEELYKLPGMPTLFEGAAQFGEQIEQAGALIAVRGNQVEMPQATPEQEVLLKRLEDRGFPRYLSYDYLERQAVEGTPAVQAMLTPEVLATLKDYKLGSTETAFWNQRLKQYRKQPGYVKFAVETIPFMLIPGGGIGKAAQGFKLLKPVSTKVAASMIGRTFPEVVKELPDLMAVPQMLEIATRPDNLRKLAQIKGMGPFAKMLAGKGGVSSTAKGASNERLMNALLLGRGMLYHEIGGKVVTIMSPLEKLGDSFKVFNLVKTLKSQNFGTIKSGPLKGVHLNTIRANPEKYIADLTEEQVKWVYETNRLKDLIRPYLEKNGFKVSQSDADTWISKGVMARIDPVTGNTEWAHIGPTVKGLGTKASYDMPITFKTAEEGAAMGFRYLPEETRLAYNLQDTYRKKANKDLVEWFQSRANWRSEEVFALPKMNNAINDALRRKNPSASAMKAFERDIPDLAKRLKFALTIPDEAARVAELNELKVLVGKLVPSETDKLFWAVEGLKKKVTVAKDAIKALQRVRRNEVLPTGTIKMIEKILPEANQGKLSGISKLTLDDLVRAGAEAAEQPKILERGTAFNALKVQEKALLAAKERLAANPTPETLREIKRLNRKIGFSKYRLAQEGDLALSKSPTSILKGKYYEAIQELLDVIKGKEVPKTGKIMPKTGIAPEKGVVSAPYTQEAVNNFASNLRTKSPSRLEALKIQDELIPKLEAAGIDTTNIKKAVSNYLEKSDIVAKGAGGTALDARDAAWKGIIDEATNISKQTVKPTGKAVPKGVPKTEFTGGLLQQFKKEAAEATKLRDEVVAQAKIVRWGESRIDSPAFRGMILTGPDAKATAKLMRSSAPSWFDVVLKGANVLNSVARYYAFAGDASPFQIQLILLPYMNRKAAEESVKGFAKAFFDPKFHASALEKNAEVIFNHPNMSVVKSVGTDITASWVRKVPLLKNFMRAYETALDVAGIEMAKSMDILIQTGRTPGAWGKAQRAWGLQGGWAAESSAYRSSQVDAFINEFRGIMSTQRIGVGSTHRNLERALALAPMYLRSVGALLIDAFRGNIRGYMVRRALIKGAAGMSAMTVAITIALSENKDNPEKLLQEVADHLNPFSHTYGTWLIAGQNVGPGSRLRSVSKLIADSIKDPKRLIQHNLNNPIIRHLLGIASPIMTMGYNLIAGTNPFTGERTRDDVLQFTKTVLARNMIPLWAQGVLFESGDSSPEGIALKASAEFFGWRTYPITPYQKLDIKRNELALEKYGMQWEELEDARDASGKPIPGLQIILERDPELQELMRLSQEKSFLLAQGEDVDWMRWQTTRAGIQKVYNDEATIATRQFQSTGDGKGYRARMSDAELIRRNAYDLMKINGDYAAVNDYFMEPLTDKQKAEMLPQKLATREYYDMMNDPVGMNDEWGEYDWNERDRREAAFVGKFGQEMLDFIEEEQRLRITEPFRLAYKEDSDMISRYKGMLPEISGKNPFDRTKDEVRELTAARDQLREDFPEIDAALNLWGYITTTKTEKAVKILEKRLDEMGIDKTRIPAIVKSLQTQRVFAPPKNPVRKPTGSSWD